MTIKHLVFSGGGPRGLIGYGVLKELHKNNFWKYDNIESIFCCSIGVFITLTIILDYDWETIDKFIIKRPWENLIDFDPDDIFNIYNTKGLFNMDFVINIVKPLLQGKDIDTDITLIELFKITKKYIYIISTNINETIMKKEIISHETHPDIKLIEAIYMTCAIPILFQPFFYKDGCYLDGGILCNFPLNECIEQTNCDPDEILAICYKKPDNTVITNETNMIDYIMTLLIKTHTCIESSKEQPHTKNTIICDYEKEKWFDVMKTEDLRTKLIDNGIKIGLDFLNTAI